LNDQKQHDSKRLWSLTLGAIGVVFGDIATSPLYSLRECFAVHHGLAVTNDNILGILSLIIWSLISIVSVKYILFVLRADNKGEGGILSLLALVMGPVKTSGGRKKWLVFLGIFGAALLYGDGMITPAITVLSAVEGLAIATPLFHNYIVIITVAILAAFFCFQSLGTARIGFIFGPIILVYLTMLTVLGLPHIVANPVVLSAINPLHGLDFLIRNGFEVFWVLGSVFLAVTGCEALYADMGHFGRRPIRVAWTYLVFPALVINYLGQGALMISDPSRVDNPFFHLAPDWALYPVVIMATLASIVASQALISGVFSLTRQAISLGFCPRLRINHTSSEEIGQIYVPAMNWGLMICTIWLVFEFKTSSNLVGAYGIAVALTMLITGFFATLVALRIWKWNPYYVVGVGAVMVCVDLVFVLANSVKIPHGGWFPLVIALAIFAMMTTWKRGRRILAIRLRAQCDRLEDYVESPVPPDIFRAPGTAIFMTTDPEMVPPAMARNLEHNHVLHERVILLSILTREVPRMPRDHRVKLEKFQNEIYRVTANFGFMESPTIQEVLESVDLQGLNIVLDDITFFLGRETLIAARRAGGMAIWREHLFSFMARNAYRATQFFRIPPSQVVEIGSQIEL
jgi:KUP system potassium uptake protein